MAATIEVILIIVAIALTVYLLKRGTNVGYIMLMDSVFLVLIRKMPLDKAVMAALDGAISDKTIKLIVILFLIMILENIMRKTGTIKLMVDSLKELLRSNRSSAAFLPVVLGLLPSPGGARFSCPMVDETLVGNTTNENKAFINYWFRHVWMDGFILYPGVIVASELIGKSVISFFIHLIPFMIIYSGIGVFLGLLKVKKEKIKVERHWKESLIVFITAMLPILSVILIYILLLNVTGFSLEIATLLIIISLFIVKKYNFSKVITTIKEAFPVKFVIIIIGVMIFKEVLLQSGAMDELPNIMNKYNIPVEVIFVILPFLGGLASGITVTYVSMTFPILIPLGLANNMWYPVLAFVAGSAGGMITPLHLCAVMTADYFKTPLGKMLVRIAIGQLIFLAISIPVLLLFIR